MKSRKGRKTNILSRLKNVPKSCLYVKNQFYKVKMVWQIRFYWTKMLYWSTCPLFENYLEFLVTYGTKLRTGHSILTGVFLLKWRNSHYSGNVFQKTPKVNFQKTKRTSKWEELLLTYTKFYVCYVRDIYVEQSPIRPTSGQITFFL